MSTLLTGVAVMLIVAVASTAGFILMSKYVPERWLIADSDAASALYATIGMVYAILIAIAAIAVWEPHDDAGQATSREASDMSEAYWSARGLAPTDSTEIRVLITQYVHVVVDQEWPSLHADHAPSPEAEDVFAELRMRVEAVQPVGDSQENFEQDVLSNINDAASARRARLAAASQGMPPLVWPTLLFGAVINIGFLYLFGLDRTFPNGLMMAIVGGMLGLVLFVIYQVEYPFSGGLSVGPDAFRTALATLGAPT